MRGKSLLQDRPVCYVCGTTDNLHLHHIFYGTANRKKSDEDGCWCLLCGQHHNLSSQGVHFNKALDERIKKQAEKLWIKEYCDEEMSNDDKIESFIRRYGRNYLDDDDV